MQLSYLLMFIVVVINFMMIDYFQLTYFNFDEHFQLKAMFEHHLIFIQSNKDFHLIFTRKFMIYPQNLFSKWY